MGPASRLVPPRDLTLPAPGSRTTRGLLSLALLRARAAVASLPSPPDPRDPCAALRLGGLLAADAGFLLSSLRRPSRLTLARCLEHGTASSERLGWGRALAAALCLDAAEAGALARPVEIVLDGPLVSERSGWALRLPAGATLGLDRGTIEVRSSSGRASAKLPSGAEALGAALSPAGAEVWPAHVPLWGDAVLLLHDTNPLAEQEAHPAKSGNRVDLGGQPPERWVEALRDALAVIESYLPEIADEMRLLLGHVGPVGWFDQQHLSASYLEAMGVVYLSLHPHRMTLVEALVHEFQHNKLNLLLGLDPVLENADWPLYTSPVRPDPRPLRGVLLAVHAFQPIVALYERLLARPPSGDEGEAAWLGRRLGQVARLCREGCEVLLPSGRPTAAGAALLGEIGALDRRFEGYVAAKGGV